MPVFYDNVSDMDEFYSEAIIINDDEWYTSKTLVEMLFLYVC